MLISVYFFKQLIYDNFCSRTVKNEVNKKSIPTKCHLDITAIVDG